MSKSSLVRLVNECGRKPMAEQAAGAEATVKAPERCEETVWRDMPELDSWVIPLTAKNAYQYGCCMVCDVSGIMRCRWMLARLAP